MTTGTDILSQACVAETVLSTYGKSQMKFRVYSYNNNSTPDSQTKGSRQKETSNYYNFKIKDLIENHSICMLLIFFPHYTKVSSKKLC